MIDKGCMHKFSKKRMGRHWIGLKFRVKLTGHKPWMVHKFNYLNKGIVWRMSTYNHTIFLILFSILGVELKAMSVAFLNFGLGICRPGLGIIFQNTGI